MTLPRLFLAVSLLLFGGIGVAAYYKKTKAAKAPVAEIVTQQPINPATNNRAANTTATNNTARNTAPIEIDLATLTAKSAQATLSGAQEAASFSVANGTPAKSQAMPQQEKLPEVDRIGLLFSKNSPLPIVETIKYKSKVPWKSGRSAWLVDYAAHYKTHLHFIARSVNGKADYNAPAVNDGEYLNVLSQNVNFYFYLLIDLSRCKLLLYTVLPDTQERILLKTYRVGLGRLDSQKKSGSLTPIGKYSLGSRIAVFKPKMMGNHKGKRVELIGVFGTRWIPFEEEIEGCSDQAKGYGLHGTPWQHAADGTLVDNSTSIGKYESDGCIRLATPDIEEIFAIISTRKAIVEIVPQFSNAKLPGKEAFY